uniref:HMG box domain-containing protein n=1 Tax=Steinernema glaseri TaxID=37863 RepID=A0A1I7XZM0_9BILA
MVPRKRTALFNYSATFLGKLAKIRPALEKATAEELGAFEKANPALVKITVPLWKRFCSKGVLPTANETWRDAYKRSEREMEARLQILKTKYREQQKKKAGGVKGTVLPSGPRDLPPVPIVAPRRLSRNGQKKMEGKRFWPNSELEDSKTYLDGVERGFLMKKVVKSVNRR